MGLVIVLGSMVHSGCVFLSKSLNCVDNNKNTAATNNYCGKVCVLF